jgi:NAD dependent epimerase/dehydratase family enzyme
MEGAFNGVAPQAVTNSEFIREAANAMGKSFIPVYIPPFPIKWILGEMSSILLEGSRVSCEKILKAGFDFRFPTLASAFGNIFKSEGSDLF